MIKVFADFHHQDLYNSLILLFEKRLGYKLYRPIGTDWYKEGYWRIFDHPDTANQFLGLYLTSTIEEIKKKYPGIFIADLNENAQEVEAGTYLIPDVTKKNLLHNGITLEAFKNTKFDIIISSVPQHIPLYNKLIDLYQPQAKHIFQVGNAWGYQTGVKNILVSSAPFPVPLDINVCFYHQEFDLSTFKYVQPQENINTVCSYIHWMKRKDLFDQYAGYFSGWNWKAYGAGFDSNILETEKIAEQMINSSFTWQYKPEGDGFGHAIFSSYACGRPALIYGSHYQNKLASHLLEDLVTCIDLERRSLQDNVDLIKKMSQPEEHRAFCNKAHFRFVSHVNFDYEEERIRSFLSNLR